MIENIVNILILQDTDRIKEVIKKLQEEVERREYVAGFIR